MKQILRLGGCYAQSTVKRHVVHALLISLYIILLPNSFVRAQSATVKDLGIPEGGLKIGDSIPEALWHLPLQVVNHPEGKDSITLNDYRKRDLIILDFWSIHCVPCVASINKMDSLNKQYPENNVAFLPVLFGKKEEGEKFARKRGWSLPGLLNDPHLNYESVPSDTITSAFSRYLAGYGSVWIYQNRLLAVPFSYEYTNDSIINNVLAGRPVDFINLSNSSPTDPSKPLFIQGNSEAHVLFRNGNKAQIARYSPTVFYEREQVQFTTIGDSSILYGVNLSLESLYYEAYKQAIFPAYQKREGIQWEISESLKDRVKNAYGQARVKLTLNEQMKGRRWMENNLYGYNLRFPEKLRESEARYFMQQDLNKFFSLYLGIRAKIEYRNKQKYAILRLRGTKEETEKLLAQEPAGLKDTLRKNLQYREQVTYDQHFKGDLGRLIQKTAPELQNVPLIDSTGIQLAGYTVNSLLPNAASADLAAIRYCLAKYKLYVTLEDKAVPVLVVREVRKQQHLSSKP